MCPASPGISRSIVRVRREQNCEHRIGKRLPSMPQIGTRNTMAGRSQIVARHRLWLVRPRVGYGGRFTAAPPNVPGGQPEFECWQCKQQSPVPNYNRARRRHGVELRHLTFAHPTEHIPIQRERVAKPLVLSVLTAGREVHNRSLDSRAARGYPPRRELTEVCAVVRDAKGTLPRMFLRGSRPRLQINRLRSQLRNSLWHRVI
jgi:hypothetical protein